MNGPPSRTLRDYLSTLGNGSSAGLVGQNLNIVTGLATSVQAVPSGGATGQVLTKVNNVDYNVQWTTAGVGDMQKSVYDPQNKNADAFARANQTGTQPASTITGLGTAAMANAGDFATAAQGALATTSIQPAGAQTLTDKRITPRFSTVASTATLTPDSDSVDMAAVTAQAAGLTIAAPIGTPTNGQKLALRIRDNGTARALTWNAAYVFYDSGQAPVTTVIGKTLYVMFMYNASTSTWDAVGGTLWGLWG